MAQLTTKEQIEAVKLGTKLHLINPFGCGHLIQHKIKIKSIVVCKVDHEKVYSIEVDTLRRHYISDLLSGCKFVFDNILEAQAKLEQVHKGLCNHEVNKHHSICKEEYEFISITNNV